MSSLDQISLGQTPRAVLQTPRTPNSHGHRTIAARTQKALSDKKAFAEATLYTPRAVAGRPRPEKIDFDFYKKKSARAEEVINDPANQRTTTVVCGKLCATYF